LGEQHLAGFVPAMVERMDLRRFEAEHSEVGRPGFPPQLMVKVWLYAYALGITSSRRIEQRTRCILRQTREAAGSDKPRHERRAGMFVTGKKLEERLQGLSLLLEYQRKVEFALRKSDVVGDGQHLAVC